MSRIAKLMDDFRESDAYQQLKTKYDELDSQTKLYLNLGVLGAIILIVLLSILIGIAKVNTLKAELNEREELIGYLNQSADTIRQQRSQQQSSRGSADLSSLPAFTESVLTNSGIDTAKAEIGAEQAGVEDKEAREALIDVKLSQINLRQLTRFLYNATEQGRANGLNIKNLNVDTKGDPSGYIDATVTLAVNRAK